MSTTSEISSGGIPTFSIKINGNAIPETLNVFSVHVEKKVNGIPTAKIVILNGRPKMCKF